MWNFISMRPEYTDFKILQISKDTMYSGKSIPLSWNHYKNEWYQTTRALFCETIQKLKEFITQESNCQDSKSLGDH